MAVRSRFTRIPKVHDLMAAGVPTEAIATYCALADHANNKTGLCWPRMETLARRLSRSPRSWLVLRSNPLKVRRTQRAKYSE